MEFEQGGRGLAGGLASWWSGAGHGDRPLLQIAGSAGQRGGGLGMAVMVCDGRAVKGTKKGRGLGRGHVVVRVELVEAVGLATRLAGVGRGARRWETAGATGGRVASARWEKGTGPGGGGIGRKADRG